MAKVLLVDDDESVRESYARLLKSGGYQVEIASNGDEAFEKLARDRTIEIVVTDWDMRGANGPNLLRKARNRLCLEIPFVVMSGDLTDERVTTARELGFSESIEKPFSKEKLFNAIDRAFQ